MPLSDLEYESQTRSSLTTSSLTYSLVVTVEMSRRDELGPQQLSDIVSVRTCLHKKQCDGLKAAKQSVCICV